MDSLFVFAFLTILTTFIYENQRGILHIKLRKFTDKLQSSVKTLCFGWEIYYQDYYLCIAI